MSLKAKNVVITTPAWILGDGVGHDVEGMARALLADGWQVHVYSPYFYSPVYESWRVDIESVQQLLQDPNTVLIHHHSIGCTETETLLCKARSHVRILRYHNVTPPEFFEGYNEEWVRNCHNGRLATIEVVQRCTHFSVPSFYDARDLVHAGADVDRIFYVPYFHKLADFDLVEPDPAIMQQLREDGRFHVLFLGRRVNNKGHLHLIRTILAYIREFDKDIVLHLVGAADSSLGKYDEEILSEISTNGLQNNVILYEKVSFASIVAFYKGCDIFLCMSEHEGFCIPVIEAEYCGMPVLAYYRRGVPEALGPTQPWFTSLNYLDYARKLREIRTNRELAANLGRAAAASVRERFDIDAIRSRFLNWIDDVIRNGRRGAVIKLKHKHRIAFVVQRYGKDVAGGAEAFARMYAENLAADYDITVVTTTSKTLDWDSQLQTDEYLIDDIPKVIRFSPVNPRNWQQFGLACESASSGQMSFADWLLVAGPDTPDMAKYLQNHAEDFDLIVNWTYLYSNARYVAELAGRTPIVCVPFFHDEAWLYIPGHRDVASCFDGFVYQTDAEQSLAEKIGGLDDKPSIVLGAGIQEEVADEVFTVLTNSPLDSPYIVYVGRIEKAKGVQELLDYFVKYKLECGSLLKLVIVGRVHDCELPNHPDVVITGFVSEFEKFRLIKHAAALINPSEFESFSLVLIESWAMSRPVLVTSRCKATSGQVARSGGGFVYQNFRDFAWAIEKLESDQVMVDELGSNGRVFYEKNYRWNDIIPKFKGFLEQAIGG